MPERPIPPTRTGDTVLAPIPHPPGKPLVGNVLDLDPSTQVQDLIELAKEYGPIFSLSIAGRRLVVVCSFELADELSDERRFDKRVWAPLQRVRAFAGDGLFTAHTFEPNWSKAHNILLPNFSNAAMRGYHPMMLDIIHQLLDRWARLNPRDEVDVSDNMTRLTLDTIGLCGFDYRFNSFYRERMHPFIRAMTRAMATALDRSLRPEIGNKLLWRQNKRFRKALALMNETVDGIIQERRRSGDAGEKADLLSCMLSGVDRATGESLDDLNIRYQIITFLIAGHETTSGLLSFATYFLLKHPQVLERAYEEVDRVLGQDLAVDPNYQQVPKLRYVRQILDESLRLWPTAPMFALYPKEGTTVLGGRYEVSKRDGLAVLIPMLHRDPDVWGDDPVGFDPDRFAPEVARTRSANAYKPFGNGQRACIGRQFALHEATLALGMILQRFRLIDHTDYQLDVQETLTLKPRDFRIQVEPRPHLEGDALRCALAPAVGSASDETEATTEAPPAAAASRHDTPLQILYGSNMGTAEGVARRLAEEGEHRGFSVSLASLDGAVGELSSEGALLIVTASYNGTPPDNAVRFCRWVEEADDPQLLRGVRYAVFGCGHRDWAATYQAVPKLVDQRLQELGAERLIGRGEGDGADDFDGDFERWDRPLWPALSEALEVETTAELATTESVSPLLVEVLDESVANPFIASFGAEPMVVIENRELQGPHSGRSTRHIELALPPGTTYQTGDHLGVIAHNHPTVVRRVAEHFGFDDQTRVVVRRRQPGTSELPLGQPIRIVRLLTDYVEVQLPATRAQIQRLALHCECPPDRQRLERLCGTGEAAQERYRGEVLERRLSLIDLLEEIPACEAPFEDYLGMLQPLRPRYYSISTSPRRFERICSITVGVAEGRARSGVGSYHGVCSSYLAGIDKGSSIYAFVRDTQTPFRPPRKARTPLILIGPGTGLAPFRGFLQDRAALRGEGRELGECLLFFGCRHPDHDFLYKSELQSFADAGLVELHVAFSRLEPDRRIYVQDRLMAQRERVWQLLEQGAVVYVCGDARHMAPDVRAAFAEIHRHQTGGDEAASETWLSELEQKGRYLVDVWAST